MSRYSRMELYQDNCCWYSLHRLLLRTKSPRQYWHERSLLLFFKGMFKLFQGFYTSSVSKNAMFLYVSSYVLLRTLFYHRQMNFNYIIREYNSLSPAKVGKVFECTKWCT